MLNMIAAAAGTVLLVATRKAKAKPDIHRIPVVGWQYIQGSMAFPVTAFNSEGMPGRRAVLFADGTVSDPNARLLFSDITTWLAAVDIPSPEEAKLASEKPVAKPTSAPVEDEDGGAQGEDNSGYEPVQQSIPATGPMVGTSATGGVGWDSITWGKEALTNNSFWSWADQNVIFVVPGGHVKPKQSGIEKITRDDYMAIKKLGAKVIDETTVSGSVEVEEDDEDDFSDML